MSKDKAGETKTKTDSHIAGQIEVGSELRYSRRDGEMETETETQSGPDLRKSRRDGDRDGRGEA